MPITIPKAIEILDLNIKQSPSKMPPDVTLAVYVAISAMRRVLDNRLTVTVKVFELLDGECGPSTNTQNTP